MIKLGPDFTGEHDRGACPAKKKKKSTAWHFSFFDLPRCINLYRTDIFGNEKAEYQGTFFYHAYARFGNECDS